jgi:hypothetical protein
LKLNDKVYVRVKIMKKVMIIVAVVVMAGTCFAGASGYNLGAVNSRITSDWFSDGGILDIGTNALRNMEALISYSSNPGTGKVWYIDSGVTNAGDGSSWRNAVATTQAAIVLSEADGGDDRGDVFLVAQGHAESGTAADLVDITVSGSTLKHLGNEANQGTYTFSDTDVTFALGAPNVRVIGGRVVAGISSITMGISFEAAADNCVLDGMVFPKPTTNSWEFLDTIDIADGANNVTIVNCISYNDEAGAAPAHFIDAGNGTAGPVELYVLNNIIKGDFSVAAIWSDEPCDEAYIAYNTITNHTTGQHCIEFTDTGTGTIAWNNCFGDTEGAIIDPGSMAEYGNIKSTAIDTPGYPGWILRSNLDHFLGLDGATQVYPENAVDDSMLAKVLTKSDPANISDYDNSIHSLEAMGDVSAKCVTKVLNGITNGLNDLFVVAGGPVKIVELIGIVTTTAIEAKSVLINYSMDPTVPAGDTAFATDGTALEINADAVGALYTWDGIIDNDLVATDNGVALGLPAPTDGSTDQSGSLIVPAGSLELAAVVATSATGQINFYLRYEPLIPGAVVTAAP